MNQSVRCDRTTREYELDPKRVLISELQRQEREHAEKPDLIAGLKVDQRVGASDVYILLDSTQRNFHESRPSTGLYVFDINVTNGTGNQMIGTAMPIHDVSEMEMASFPFPILPLNNYTLNATANSFTPALIANPAQPTSEPLKQVPFNRIMVQISETSMESISDYGGVRHNFELDINNMNGTFYGVPVIPVYIFSTPQVSFSRLTLQFRTPYRKLNMLSDIENGRFAVTAAGLLTIYFPSHGLDVEDVIYLRDVSTQGLAPKIYNYVQGENVNGLVVGANSTTDYIRLNPDISMTEFIENSLVNNYLITSISEAATYGFTDFNPSTQIIIPAIPPSGTTDFANFTVNRSFTVAGKHIRNVNQIISLTAQVPASNNGYYQITNPSTDILATGVKLTKANTYLVNPILPFKVLVPKRSFRIPMRFRRVLRKVTQLSGI